MGYRFILNRFQRTTQSWHLSCCRKRFRICTARTASVTLNLFYVFHLLSIHFLWLNAETDCRTVFPSLTQKQAASQPSGCKETVLMICCLFFFFEKNLSAYSNNFIDIYGLQTENGVLTFLREKKWLTSESFYVDFFLHRPDFVFIF